MGVEVTQPGDITVKLRAWIDGDESARDQVVELVYGDLRRLAQRRMRGDHVQTIDATGLAHEAFLKRVEQSHVRWENRAQFFAVAARVMRRILVDRHRARNAEKRGDGATRLAISEVPDIGTPVDLDLELLDRALQRLALQDARQAEIVELRFFGGLSIEETAEAVGVSPATIKREWALARAWLKRELDDAG